MERRRREGSWGNFGKGGEEKEGVLGVVMRERRSSRGARRIEWKIDRPKQTRRAICISPKCGESEERTIE